MLVELDSMVTLPYHEDRMHDGSAPGWREIMDRHHAALTEELAAQVNAEVASHVAQAVRTERAQAEAERIQAEADRARAEAEAARTAAEERTRSAEAQTRAVEEGRRRISESLNQTLRRIRQTAAEHETLQLLLEESAFAAERAVVVLVESSQARIAAWRGVVLRGDEEDSEPIDLKEAAALASCVESRDPLVALSAPGEISSVLASALGRDGDQKIYLFPVTARRNTVAVLVAAGVGNPAPIELLCEAAGMKLESLEAPAGAPTAEPAAKSDLVQIAGSTATTWNSLTPEEQALHLRAQRTARVRVAQIRISESTALRRGVQEHNIYGALRVSIDSARNEFQKTYMAQTPDMVDYLHLEIVRSLAHDNERLLGQEYPGPIA